ncbi:MULTISPECIES: ABC transporter substrate-binding protein [unclassified Chelatococcus]|uniref:ABC transporter substrate-binding protein n=1 Tax=unclassified Chelatococcus TaxID=2638111 RepID=UPI001BCEA282|nr:MULTISPECIES: ABC transporter substrate-binding protein [unclassified Chelatococcus]MBS7697446.1 ABC transporter substrate-binding protein [Chelatococcus sp. YT9]MBX3559243.1 ABC transporter substrate-binding protein [Chelatococcus sp.]
MIKRHRKLSSALLGLGAVTLSVLAAFPAFARDKLVVTSFGGDYEKIHRKLVIEPFSKKYDVDVQVVTIFAADALAQLRAQKASPQFDVVHLTAGLEAIAAEEGLLSPIRQEELSNAKDLYPFATTGLDRGEGPVISVSAMGLVYNREQVSPPPNKWKDLWDDRFRDRIIVVDMANGYGLLAFLMYNRIFGGDLTDVTPGMTAVKNLLDRATVLFSPNELMQNFAQGNTWLAAFGQDYAYVMRKAGLPVSFVFGEEGIPASYFTASVVANRPNQDLAKKFIDMELSAEVQKGWAEEMRYSPSNRTTKLEGPAAEEVVYGEAAVAKLIRVDPLTVASNLPGWKERWMKLIGK